MLLRPIFRITMQRIICVKVFAKKQNFYVEQFSFFFEMILCAVLEIIPKRIAKTAAPIKRYITIFHP